MGTLTFQFSQWTNPATRPDTACPGQSWLPAAGRVCSPGEEGRCQGSSPGPWEDRSSSSSRPAFPHPLPEPVDAAEPGPALHTPVGLPASVTLGEAGTSPPQTPRHPHPLGALTHRPAREGPWCPPSRSPGLQEGQHVVSPAAQATDPFLQFPFQKSQPATKVLFLSSKTNVSFIA